MFLPIREGIAEVLHELKQLRKDTEHTEDWAESFGNQLGKALGPQDTAAKKPEMKRPKASPREEEWMKVPARKSLRKKKPKPEAKKPDFAKACSPRNDTNKAYWGSELRGHLKRPQKARQTWRTGCHSPWN